MKTFNALLSASVFFLLLISQALAAPPGGHLNITQVLLDDPNDPTSITIVGDDLLFGSDTPTVMLGDYLDPLVIVGVPTNEVIVALLPENIVAGDYLLTVAAGNGQSQNDEYDLTLGAVGPQGEQGKQGVPGADGADGVDGAPGAKGDKGDKGDTGATGADGAPGVDGAPGQDGLNGMNGQDGANCYDGIGDSVADCIGPQGDQGPPGEDAPDRTADICALYIALQSSGAPGLPDYCDPPGPDLNGKVLFVTSLPHRPDFGGLDGADEQCTFAAQFVGLRGDYQAWLSDANPGGSPSERSTRSATPYINTQGQIIAQDWDELTDGYLDNQILDESGIGFFANVWTNTDLSGAAVSLRPEGTCLNWTAETASANARVGVSDETQFGIWTDSGVDTACDFPRHLYCIEQ